MKVLTYVSKIYEDNKVELTNDSSGLALYVHEIVNSLSTEVDCYVLTGQPTSGGQVGAINYLPHRLSVLLKKARLSDYVSAFKEFITCGGPIKYRLKSAYYRLDVATFRDVIHTLRPDVVNIHGCHLQIMNQIEVCIKNNIPYVVSLHGLIGIDDTVKATKKHKKLEGALLAKADKNQWPIVAISSGVKQRATDFYRLKNPSNITVILNGTKVHNQVEPQAVSLCDNLTDAGKKIITCVGGLSERKNQIQLVEAWTLLPTDVRSRYAVVFFGYDLTNGLIASRIESLGLKNEMYVYGLAKREEINYAYQKACLNVLPSKDEGFGLSIIEAMTYGVPSVIFSDIDAANDLYSKNAIMLIPNRLTDSLASTILKALEYNWDKDAIKAHGNNFSMQNVCEKYIRLYYTVIENKRY